MLPSPTEIGAGFRFDIPPLSERKSVKLRPHFLGLSQVALGSRESKIPSEMEVSTVLYTAYTVDTV